MSGTCAQWRQLNWKNRESIEEIAAKLSGFNRLVKIYVGRGNDTHVRLEHFIAAHARELSVLKHAQQAHLSGGAHLTNFIKKERAAVGLFKTSAPPRARVSKCAFLVSRQFRFEQGFRNRAAVELDVRLVLAAELK